MEAILSLGSNLGDRCAHLTAALDALASLPHTRLVAASRLYDTEPVLPAGSAPQPAFLNAIVVLETTLEVHDLSTRMHAIEDRLGRLRTAERPAPRIIDIDLICCGAQVLDEPCLRLPHPRAASRRFVCAPLAEVRPDLVLPGQTRTVRDLLAALPCVPGVRLAREQWAFAT